MLLAFHPREVAVAQHELDAGLRPGSQSHENLVLLYLLLYLLMPSGQGCACYLLVYRHH